jgi:hypothetical protein
MVKMIPRNPIPRFYTSRELLLRCRDSPDRGHDAANCHQDTKSRKSGNGMSAIRERSIPQTGFRDNSDRKEPNHPTSHRASRYVNVTGSRLFIRYSIGADAREWNKSEPALVLVARFTCPGLIILYTRIVTYPQPYS